MKIAFAKPLLLRLPPLRKRATTISLDTAAITPEVMVRTAHPCQVLPSPIFQARALGCNQGKQEWQRVCVSRSFPGARGMRPHSAGIVLSLLMNLHRNNPQCDTAVRGLLQKSIGLHRLYRIYSGPRAVQRISQPVQ